MLMLIRRCPAGHLYVIAGQGKDLAQGIRPGTSGECPACSAKRLRADATEDNRRYAASKCAS